MLLTIGMMVKNEEKHLKECLDSLAPLLDNLDAELVIVDTGSEDSTVEIAKRYTDKLYFHKWNDNFSEMRNITISYAKGEWFFVIDGDEVLENSEKIIEFFKTGEYIKYYSASMGLKNFTNSMDLNQYGLCDTIRLFRNDGEFRYEGTVHNQPIFKQPTKRILCGLQHYGYISDDKELMEKKFIRTSTILKKELEKNPNNIYYRCQLAVSYVMHKDFKDALTEISYVYNLINTSEKYKYRYIYNEYANILMANNKFKECEELCEKELLLTKKDEVYKIDLLFFLAKSQCFQGDYKNSIKNYNKYIRLLDKLERGILPIDLSLKVLSSSDKKIAYNDIIIMQYNNCNYLEVLKSSLQLREEDSVKSLLSNIIYSHIKLGKIKELRELYNEYYIEYSLELIIEFQSELEKIKLDLKDEALVRKIEKEFLNINDSTQYKNLNLMRLCENKDEVEKIYRKILYSIDLNNESLCYGDLLYIAIKNKYDVISIVEKLKYDNISLYLEYLKKKYEDIEEVIIKFLKNFNFDEGDFMVNRTIIILTKALLIWDEISEKDYKIVFDYYVNNGIELIKKVYSNYVLDSEMVSEVKNNEHEFFVYMNKAEKMKNDKISYLRYLKMALRSYPQMKNAINYILDNIKEEVQIESSEIQELKRQLIHNVNVLLSDGQLLEVKNIIENYKNMFSCDADIYSVESVMLIMEEKYEKAEEILLKALNEDENNIDLLYNLGYVYKIQEKNKLAYRAYKKLQKNCNDNELLEEINEILGIMEEEVPEIECNIEKEKIVFFVRSGMDSFIDGIIKEFGCNYETKKVIVTEYNQIDEGMKWADICWFEWCDELISYGSRHELANYKKILCRLHSYEAFAGFAEEVNWNNVDKLIFVSEYIKENVLEKININLNKIEVIPNEIDYSKFTFKNKTKGYNIAYVGYLNYKKGPMLLIHAFKALYDLDNKYKLYIAGEFQDERYVLYLKQMIEEFGLQDNVFYEGWQSDLNTWLEDKNYILCTSLLESQNISVMQAMSKGIKPLIHNFVGAKRIYDDKYIWSSIDELVKMIQEDSFDPKEYSAFVTKNYSKDKTIGKIIECVENLEKDNNNITSFRYVGKEINFYLPYKNDHIENVINNTNNFYEIQMLEDVRRRIGLNKVIVDVGANIGNHTVFFANICEANKVYSFEPQKNIYDILCRNVNLNQYNKNVNLFNMGVGKEISKGSVKIIDNENFGMSKLEKGKEGNIDIDTLDNMLFEKEKKIDMIKIDVEGMEMDVLMGAEKILKEYKPILYIEAATDDYFNEISNYLKKFNYKAKMRFNHTPTYLFE